jgi:hypothetical protein
MFKLSSMQLTLAKKIATAAIVIASTSLAAAADQTVRYFPPSEFRDLDKLSVTEPQMWSRLLSEFEEPSISDPTSTEFTVRLTVLPAFSYSMVVRISEKDDGKVTGVSKQLPPRAKSPLIVTPISLNPNDISDVKKSIADNGFWKLTSRQTAAAPGETVVESDGIEFLLEVNDHRRYHAVFTSQDGSVTRIGKGLLALAHLHLPGE